MSIDVGNVPWLHAEARFQVAYAQLLTDERFRERVLQADACEESTSGISAADLDRLRAIDAERVEMFAQCLFGNRMAAIQEAFPLTCKVIGNAVVVDLIRALDDRNVAMDTRKYPEAARFADFMLDSDEACARSLPEPVLTLLHYEWVLLKLRVRPVLQNWPDTVVRSTDALRSALERKDDVRLILDRNHALAKVRYDIDSLRENEWGPWLEADEDMILLLHRGENAIIHQKHLNYASAAAILMIDGTRSFPKLLADVAAWLGLNDSSDLETSMRELCFELCACDVLGFVPADASAEAA